MTFDRLIQEIEAANHNDWLRDDEVGVSTLLNNVNITVRKIRKKGEELLREPWATKHFDRDASVCKVDLYFGASFVKRYHCANVDGGRATIPYPKSRDELTISREEYAIGAAVDLIGSLDAYLNKCGIKVV